MPTCVGQVGHSLVHKPLAFIYIKILCMKLRIGKKRPKILVCPWACIRKRGGNMTELNRHTPDRPRIVSGHVVTTDQGGPVMTVESIQQGAFGPIASCLWFSDENMLMERKAPVRMLSLQSSLVHPDRIKTGAKIRLRSGGPTMDVVAINRDANRAICKWTNHNDTTRQRRFPLTALTLISTQTGGFERLVNVLD